MPTRIPRQDSRVSLELQNQKTVLGLVGDTSDIDVDLLRMLDIVDAVKRITDPFKKANRKFHPEDSVIEVGESKVKIGGGNFAVIAGPCSVESEEQIIEVAQKVKAAGATLLRGGAFKPRTSPYDFQGAFTGGKEGDWTSYCNGDHECQPYSAVRRSGFNSGGSQKHAEF